MLAQSKTFCQKMDWRVADTLGLRVDHGARGTQPTEECNSWIADDPFRIVVFASRREFPLYCDDATTHSDFIPCTDSYPGYCW